MITNTTIFRFLMISAIYLAATALASGQDINYLPATVNNNQVLNYTQFSLSYNEEHEQADWVAYKLTEEEVAMQQDRCNCFKSDRQVTTKSAVKSDYRSTGFDLGHLAPAADNNLSKKANEESFLMSNISPQTPSFNRGIWKQLEGWVRSQAELHSAVYVVTGPVFSNNLGTLGKNNVTIPGYFYKVLLRPEGEKMVTIAFLIPHLGASNDIRDYIVTVNTVETLTKLDFFPHLDDSMENSIESQYRPKKWGL